MTTYEEIAAILHPLPAPGSIEPEDVYNDACWEIDKERQDAAQALEIAWDVDESEPLLRSIALARRRKEEAEEEIRLLLAYGREFIRPRPYTLAELAAAAGMSVSGVRTAYDHAQVAAVAEAIGRTGRDWRAIDPSDPPDSPDTP